LFPHIENPVYTCIQPNLILISKTDS
jgi:hypothetical protein